MRYDDEDYGYEMQRQRRVDDKQTVRIGATHLQVHRPQRYARTDPSPHIPFTLLDREHTEMDALEKVISVFCLVAVVFIIIFTSGALL